MVKAQVAVIELGQSRVAHPEVIRTYLYIRYGGMMLNRNGIIHPQSPQGKDTGRGTSVSFFLGDTSGGVMVHTQSPYAAIAAQSARVGPQHALPFALCILFYQGQGHVGAVPRIRNTYDGLSAALRHLGTGCTYHQAETEKQVLQILEIHAGKILVEVCLGKLSWCHSLLFCKKIHKISEKLQLTS